MKPDEPSIRVGHARIDISPARECRLLGYDQRLDFFPGPGHAGIHDPLVADILILQSKGSCVAVVTLDLCILETAHADVLRQAIASEAGADAVVLACSHTHSGPYPWFPPGTCREPVPHPLQDEHSRRYAESLGERLRECAGRAASDLCDAELLMHIGVLGLGYTRRFISPEGRLSMVWDARDHPDLPVRPGEDPSFNILRIRRRKGDILLWNAAAHAVVLGKQSNVVSADWPGRVRSLAEAAMPGTMTMFLHGAGADVHPWLATGSRPGDLDLVAAPAAGLLALAPLLPGRSCSPARLHFLEAALPGAGSRLMALRIGPARLLAVPAELFGRTGASLRPEFPDLLLATTSNGWDGYWPPSECFPEGGHEVDAALAMGRRPEDCGNLLASAKSLLSSL